jgi:hypothetical protein
VFGGRGLRSERRATAMVTAAASTARPTIWPPTSRVLSGNDADTSLTRRDAGAGTGDGSGVGETCGKATPGSVTALGSNGSEPDGSTPSGRFPPGSAPGSSAPTPGVAEGGSVPPPGLPEGVPAAVIRTLPDADAPAPCGEVPVAVNVIWLPAAPLGTATAARNWTAWLAVRATEHAIPPVVAQTVKLGASLPGPAAMLTFAVPLTLPASQTQTA